MTQKQSRVMEALLTHSTKEAAAQAAGVNRETVDRYLDDPDFRDEYDARRRWLLDAACSSLQRSMADAVSTLTEIMSAPKYAPQARIQAARSVLEYGVKFTELTDLAARVAALEKAAKEDFMWH